jgi:hypothetical protein
VFRGRSSRKEAEIEELRAKLKAGSIIYLHCDFIDNPKDKYMVIVYIDINIDASFVFIVNSEIAPFIERDPHLKEGQILLSKEPDYTFLDHDSYVNCFEPYDCLDLDFTIHHLVENPGDLRGELKKEERDKIVAYVKIAQTISNYDRDIIIKSLSD